MKPPGATDGPAVADGRRPLPEHASAEPEQGDVFPCSSAQRRLFFLDRWEPGSALYNIPFAARIEGALDARVLERSLAALVRRHEALRTTFANAGAEPVQIVARHLDLTLSLLDLAAEPADDAETRVLELARAEAARPFDLLRGPLLRALLVRLAPRDHLLVLTVHHIVSDAWSQGLLLGDLARHYEAFSRGDAPSFATPPLQYADFAAWQRQVLLTDAHREDLEYWESRLAGAPAVLSLPGDRPRPAVQSGRGATQALDVPAEVVTALETLCRGERATLFMALLAGFEALLLHWTGEEDLIVGTPVAGRGRPELEQVVGCFINTLALRIRLSGDSTFRALLGRVRDTCLEGYEHQDLPFERLVERLRPERHLSHTPLFQVMLVLDNVPAEPLALPGLTVRLVPVGTGTAKHDLTLALARSADGLRGVFEYATDLFDAPTMGSLARAFNALLAAVVASPDLRLTDPRIWKSAGGTRPAGWRAPARLGDYRIPLQEIETTLRDHPGVRDAIAVVRQDAPGGPALAAYWTARDDAPSPAPLAVGRHLSERLPAYMVPAALVRLEALPLTADGTVDHEALPTPAFGLPEDERAGGSGGPGRDIERTLARIWAEALRVESVGLHDNFFAAGGDSILSLLIVARAQQEGIAITPRQLFQHQTIARLAAAVAAPAAAALATAAPAEQGPIAGEVPLTPIQSWFLERELADPHHWNQSFMLEVRRPVSLPVLREAVRHLHAHHDALRLRFERLPEGWRQHHVGADPPAEVACHELAGLPEDAQERAMANESARLQAGLDLSRGPLLNLALFDLGTARTPRLLIAAHHLVVDGVSWRILIDDLETACRQVARGERPRLPPKTTSFRDWARRLADLGRDGEVRGESGWWRGEAARTSVRLPRDLPDGENLEATADSVRLTLSEDETGALLRETTRACRARLDELLLAALARAMAPWTGGGALRVDLEGHGREDLFEGVDLTRTVGWFTSIFPVVLPLQAARSTSDAGRGAALRAVKEAIRRVPRHGIGYGILRHLGRPDDAARLRAAPGAEIAFNDFGRLEEISGSGFFGFAGHDAGPERAPAARRSHLIEVDVLIVAGRLRVRWTYSRACHERATVDRLAGRFMDEVRAFIAADGASGRETAIDREAAVPSDFPLADLEPAELESLLPPAASIEDIYPLTPMQQGMLFHTLVAPGSGEYVEQLACTLRGDLDPRLFERAWQQVLDRHEALRVAVHWDRPGLPLQIVHRRARVPLALHDWRDATGPERQVRLEALLRDDRERGFDLGCAPLVRLALCRVATAEHRFVFSHHHLMLDGWSLAIVLKEVFECYDALRQGLSPHREPGPRFADYVAWLSRQDTSAAATYWRAALAGFATPTPIGGRDVTTGETGREEREVRLDETATEALEALVRREAVTLNTLVLGAWALLLSRRSGADDVVLGATVSGRPPALPDVAHLVGLCINTLPVRVRVPSGADLPGWVRDLQMALAEMRQYEHTSLAAIRGLSSVPPGRPLFESVLVFENYPVEAPLGARRGEPKVEEVRSFEWTNLPLTVGVAPGRRLSLAVSWDRARFTPDEGAGLLEEYRALLEEIARHPVQSLAGLLRRGGVVSAPPRPVAPLARAAPHGRHTAIHERIAARAALTPAADAVRCGDLRLGFAALERRANSLARLLVRRGAGPERLVGVCLRRSADVPVAVLGILKAGAAFAPLDPDWPAERLRRILGECRPAAVVSQSALRSRLPADLAAPLILLDGEPDPLAEETPDPIDVAIHPDALAYVISTSGSSGVPKGVQVPHRALLSHATALARRYDLGPEDRVLQFAALSFDVSVEEMFPTWLAGGCVVLRSDDTPLVVPDFISWIGREGVTVLNLPASYWHALVDALADERPGAPAAPVLPACVRLCVVGSEPVAAAQWERWRARVGPGVRLLNAYGPTEATITATLYEQAVGSDPIEGPTVPIGVPIPGVEACVLDGALRPAAIGVPGDLYLGGCGLARGYLGRPDLTAERFIPHPSGSEPGERLYATGDRAVLRPDRSIIYIGRSDSQVKVRGFRIEPGEIETALRTHPQVRDAAVVLQTGPVGGRLAAFAVAAPGRRIGAGELRDHIVGHLPDYMLPATITLVEALPLTPAGKVDRVALASRQEAAGPPALARPEHDDSAGSDPVPQIIAGIWAEILGIDRPGREDDFFVLGGHSLLATQVVSRLRDAFGIEIPLRALFENPTVETLAARVRDARRREHSLPETLPLARGPRPNRVPLSFAQERQWFLDQLVPDRPIYNVHVPLRATGDLDVRALRRALNALVRRHEVLRTVFDTVEGRPLQLIKPRLSLPLPVVDLRALGLEEREAAARRLSTEEARRPFDLRSGPLLRARLLQLGERDHVVLITMHHIVSDGWSAGVSARELAFLYAAYRRGAMPALPDPPIQYADFAIWQRTWLQGETLARQIAYWRKQLAGAPEVARLPTDRPRPVAQSFEGATEIFLLPAALTEPLERLSRRAGCTLFMVLLAGFQALLARYTGERDIVVGSPIAGRGRTETEGLIGFFVNTLVLRTDLTGDPSFRELVRRVREVCLDAYTHQDLPFEKLVEDLAPERALGHSPLVQVMFQLQTAASSSLELEGLSLTPLDVDTGTTQFDLSVDLLQRTEGLEAQVEYSTDLFDSATVRRLMTGYRTLLEAAVEDPERRLGDLPILTEEDRQVVLEPGAAIVGAAAAGVTEAGSPEVACLHRLFETQARLRPGAVALDAGDDALTYGDMDRRADRLAGHLRRAGVGPEKRVAVCLPRSPLLATALMAILKAGGVYVPLDPDHPSGRLSDLLDDAKPRLILTRESLRGRLPAGAPVLSVDADLPGMEEGPVRVADVDPESTAYMIYTSGSTGRPKGVLVPHRASVNHARAVARAYGLGPGDRVLQFAAAGFDVAIEELLASWASGADVVLLPHGNPPAPADLNETIARRRLTVLNLPSSYWHEWVNELAVARDAVPPCLRLVVVGSEPIDPVRYAEWRRLAPPEVRWIGAYGTTETAVTSLLDEPATEAATAAGDAMSIGRPLANVEALVLDDRLRPLPQGAVGELYLGGACLGHGYLGRPDLTAARFVPHPWSPSPGARLFRTGDRARLRPDRRIDFLGRADRQVKVRGHRIELGEIEAALCEHPSVADAAVVLRDDDTGTPRLVAYVAPKPGRGDASLAGPEADGDVLSAERLDDWRLVHDDELFNREAAGVDPAFNISGWNSSYNGAPIPAEEMRAWVDGTVERVLALAPRRVLEIGCGTGLLLLRIAPRCAAYVGTDFSRAALESVRGGLAAAGAPLSHVELREREASDFSGFEMGSFDLVLLNSVAQYFPGVDYLVDVVERSLRLLRPGGSMFLGDLRSLPLLKTFHASVILHQAADTLPVSRIEHLLRQRLAQEEELLVAPGLLPALRRRLPAITRVDVQIRRGRRSNEMTRFRYDAILGTGPVASDAAEPRCLDWRADMMTIESLERLLVDEAPDLLRITRVPNARLADVARALDLIDSPERPRMVGDLRVALAQAPASPAVDPEDLWSLAGRLPYAVEICWSDGSRDGCCDVLFRRAGRAARPLAEMIFDGTAPEAGPPRGLTNDPLREKVVRLLMRALPGYLQDRLPPYMVPSTCVPLDALPRAASGKVDRGALPPPDESIAAAGRGAAAARDALEVRLVQLFEEVLDVRPVGVTDSFFDLGGHSLLAVRLVALVHKRLGREVPLAAVFQGPTVEKVAAVCRLDAGGQPLSPAVALQPHGAGAPFFCVHPAGGGVLHYRNLARHLDNRPFIALHAPGLYGERAPLQTLEAIAEVALASVRSLQPRGPYALGGWSFGGLVAFEMALRLSAAGEEVALLALLDAIAPETGPAPGPETAIEPEEDDASVIAWYAEDFARFFGGDLPDPRRPRLLSAADLRPLDPEERLRYLHGVAAAVNGLPPDAGIDRVRRYVEVYQTNHRAAALYRPHAAYPGKVTIFRAVESPADTAIGWRPWVSGPLQIHEVPGTHETFIEEPNVPALARQLRLCLDQALGAS